MQGGTGWEEGGKEDAPHFPFTSSIISISLELAETLYYIPSESCRGSNVTGSEPWKGYVCVNIYMCYCKFAVGKGVGKGKG